MFIEAKQLPEAIENFRNRPQRNYNLKSTYFRTF